MSMTKVGVGVSQKDNLAEAAREAAQEAKKTVENPKLLMVFVTFNYPHEDYQTAVDEVQKTFSDKIPLVGGSALGFFANDQVYDAFHTGGKTKAISVLALASDYLTVGVGIGSEVDKNPEQAGRDSILQALNNLEYNPSVARLAMTNRGVKDLINIRPINAFLLTPAVTTKHMLMDSRILQGISAVTKRNVRLIGGGTSEFDFKSFTWPSSHQFFNGKVYEESVISIVLGSDLEIGYGIGSGYEVLGPGAFVTKGEGWTIEELNEKPALEVFKDLVSRYTEVKAEEIGENLIPIGCKGITMGPSEATGDFYWPNFPIKVVNKTSLLMIEEIRKGMGLALLRINKNLGLEGATSSASSMKEDAGAENFDFVLFFSCGGRGFVFGDDYGQEIKAIRDAIGKEPTIFGLVSCGESGFYKTGSMMATKLTIPMMGISDTLIAEEK